MQNLFFISVLIVVAITFASCGGNKSSKEAVKVDEVKVDEIKDFTESESLHSVREIQWGIGVSNGSWETPSTRIVVTTSLGSSKEYTHAVCNGKVLNIKYIGEKKTKGEPTEWDFYFETYDNTIGSEYEIVGSIPKGWYNTLFLYNDSETWGGVPNNIIHSMDYSSNEPRPTADKNEIADMEKQQGGRKIIYSEVFAEFAIDGKENRLMLMRYQNTDDGLFKIVLRDNNNDYFTADFPCDLYGGEAAWRADLPDEPGQWDILFVGRVAEGLFLVNTWSAPEGKNIVVFVAKDGKLEEIEWWDNGEE